MIKKITILLLAIFLLIFIFLPTNSGNQKIVIASSLANSGSLKHWGNSVVNSFEAYLDYAAKSGLIDGKNLEFIYFDDKYEPQLSYENIQNLLNQNIFAFYGLIGTPTTKEIIPLIQNKDVFLFSPFSGASFLRDEKLLNVINFRASYYEELENLINYVTKDKKLTKIAIFYQNDEYGEEGYFWTMDILKKRNLNLVSASTYQRNTLSISHAFNEIKNSNPEAIFLIGAYKANSLFIKRAKNDTVLKDVLFCNISFSDANSIVKELDNSNISSSNIIFSQVVPNYEDDSLAIVREYKELMKNYAKNKELSFISFETFLTAKILVNAVLKSKDNINSKNLIKYLKNPPKDILKEIKLDYKNYQLQNKTYLFSYENGKFQEIIR